MGPAGRGSEMDGVRLATSYCAGTVRTCREQLKGCKKVANVRYFKMRYPLPLSAVQRISWARWRALERPGAIVWMVHGHCWLARNFAVPASTSPLFVPSSDSRNVVVIASGYKAASSTSS
jgi:hypothetical protein